ncbi:MAG: hypothetical protein CL797_11655 [Chromatiales bacterium]|nr:hypothetical protein [Chromatiales bacterium]
MKMATRITIVLMGLAGILTAIPSYAAIDEMIVTSEHREENLQDVPIAVSAMDGTQMEKLQIGEARDLQRYVPSLNMYNNITHPSNLSLSLRGGLQQDASLVVAESPVGIYVDDIYVGRLNGNNITMSDLERVEVLRGPQGTLYGRNTGYGAIRFISRTPGEDKWLNASVGMGNDDQLLLKSSVGGPLNDSWAGSLSAQWIEKDGQYFNIHPSANTETGLEENLTARGKLRFTGSENFDAVLSIAFSESDNDSNQLVNATTPNVPDNCQDPSVMDPLTGTCPAGVITQFTSNDLTFTHGPRTVNTAWGDRMLPPLKNNPQASTEQTIMGLTLTWDLTDNLTLKSITGYVGLDGNFMTDFAGNNGAVGGSETESDQITQEFRLIGSAFGDRFNYVAGVYYLNEEADQLWGWSAGPPPGLSLSTSTIEVETDSISVYGEGSFNVTDALKLTAGLRYTEDDKDMDMTYQLLLAPVPLGTFSDSQKPDAWTPKFAIDYAFETSGALDSMLLYGSYAEGFKGAGWSTISITTFVHERYTEETIKTMEAGLKAEWFDNRLRTNLAYYFSDIEDIQQNSTVDLGGGNLAFPVQNSGDVEIQGLEFEITAVPVDGLNLFVSGTAFTDGEYQNLRASCGPLATQPEGCSAAERATYLYGVPAETPQTPDFTYNIGFDYTMDMPFGDLSFGMDYYDMDDYITSATNDFHNSGWEIFSGFIAASIGDNWKLKLTGKNLADDDNITTGSRGLGGFITMAPVEYMFTATYQL